MTIFKMQPTFPGIHQTVAQCGTPEDEKQQLLETIDRLRATKYDPELLETIEHLRHIIDRDRYIVSAILGDIRKAVEGHRWLLSGRGPYEWDDDRYREEFTDWVRNIDQAAETLSLLAWDKEDCTLDEERVIEARKAAARFLTDKPLRPHRKMIPSDLGLPCPRCKQTPEAMRPADMSAAIEALTTPSKGMLLAAADKLDSGLGLFHQLPFASQIKFFKRAQKAMEAAAVALKRKEMDDRD